MAEVTLTAAVRQSLLSLQSTTGLIERTQNRMSTGLKVAGPIDDPVAYFQAKGLNDRAADFREKKDSIDQGVSSVSAALDGISSVESIINQMKGIANSLKTAETSQVASLITQFNDLRNQIGYLTTDATYQGTNLINGTGSTLSVEFSNETTSRLSITSVDATATGLAVGTMSAEPSGATLAFNVATSGTAQTLSPSESLTLTYGGSSARTLTAGGTYTIAYGTANFTIATSVARTLSANTAYTFTVVGTSTLTTTATTGNIKIRATTAAGGVRTLSSVIGKNFVSAGGTDQISSIITTLDAAKTTLRTNASTLGTNVALLKTRLDFTNQYVQNLESGAGKLTLAEINDEGANLLALQTRQQLGINALSLAGQAEQSVLSLFR